MLIGLADLSWITIVQIVCATIVTVVGIIMKRAVDENTKVTTERADELSGKIDKAAEHAKSARIVGIETLKTARKAAAGVEAAAENTEVVQHQIKELQEDSRLIKGRADHFKEHNLNSMEKQDADGGAKAGGQSTSP